MQGRSGFSLPAYERYDIRRTNGVAKEVARNGAAREHSLGMFASCNARSLMERSSAAGPDAASVVPGSFRCAIKRRGRR